ncbi:uncharacterized protein [Watersipora subatra]|uniref:uncharacterized protein n=1 Tax=Watersipora subatra TaxID=2589382 RepID=UPI00355AE7A4
MECSISHVVSPGHFYAQRGTAKEFLDFEKLVALIQKYCDARTSHFHNIGNIEKGEIIFFKSATRDGEYVRGEVIATDSDSCSTCLIDYGVTELGVTSVLKIDPSVKRFATIEPRAKRFALAFVKPTRGEWCKEATELFRQHCQPTTKLIYLPTEDPDYVTLVTRRIEPPNGIIDVSVLLIQAGHAKRVSSIYEDVTASPSIAASISDVTQQLHSVGIQTDPGPETNLSTCDAEPTDNPFISSTSGLLPPPGFDTQIAAAGDSVQRGMQSSDETQSVVKPKSSNPYVPPALRKSQRSGADKYQQFNLNHEALCICIICSIRHAFEDNQMTNKEKLDTVLATDWPKLTSKEDTILKRFIIGDQLTSEDRELLLDIILGVTRQQVDVLQEHSKRKSIDSSIQVTSNSNKLTLSSYTVQSDVQTTAKSDNITIMQESTDRPHSNTTFHNPDPSDPQITSSVHSPLSGFDDDDDDDDPAYKFLESSDSESDIVLESCNSAAEDFAASKPSAALTSGTADGSFSSHISAAKIVIPPHNQLRVGRGSPLRPYGNYSASPTSFQHSAENSQRSQSSSRKSFNNFPTSANHRPKAPIRNQTKVVTYGLGLSATNSYQDNSTNYNSDNIADADEGSANERLGGFGMIMYCTFCGSTEHRSANCPDGTKNLFIN